VLVYRWLLPSATLVVVLLLTLAPLGWPQTGRLAQLLLPVIPIHYWSLERSERMPAGLVFLVGIVVDSLFGGPLGYWTLVYLVACVSGRIAGGDGAWKVWAATWRFGIAILPAGLLAFAIPTLYALRPLEAQQLLEACILVAAAYPVCALVFRVLASGEGVRSSAPLRRGAAAP